MRCQTSSSGKPISAYSPHPAISKPPTGAYQLRVMRTAAGPGLSYGSTHRQAARDEEQEQAEQDEVVRRVGQRTGVAALADVQADVPDEAEQRADDAS